MSDPDSGSRATTLAAKVEARIVRRRAHAPDWSVSKAWSSIDPRYRRALVRCIAPASDARKASDALTAEHFTLFMEVFPPGTEGGLHRHPDAEEAYIVLEGDGVRLKVFDEVETYETALERLDVALVPTDVYRVIRNEGPDEALVMVVLGSGEPKPAKIEPGHPMANVAR